MATIDVVTVGMPGPPGPAGPQGDPGAPGGGGSNDAVAAPDFSAIPSNVSGRYYVTGGNNTLPLGTASGKAGVVIELFFTPTGATYVITSALGISGWARVYCNEVYPFVGSGNEDTLTLTSVVGGRIVAVSNGTFWLLEGQVKGNGAWSGGV